MKELILKQADDKLYCLFQWSPEKKTFSKIAEGKICKQLNEYGSCFLLGNDEKDCQVYEQRNGELTVIPVHCQNVAFIGDICTYERNGEWYGFIAGNEVLLGKRYELSLSLWELCKSEEAEIYYFVSGDETKEYVLSVIYRSTLIQGNYCGALYRQKQDYLVARRKDGNYDIISPSGFFVYDEDTQSKRYFSDNKKRIYFWDEAKSSWKMVAEDGFVWANNALIRDYKNADNQTYSILFEVSGTSLKERARGKFKACKDGSFSIGEMIFFEDYKQKRVDFVNWRYSFKGKLKKLLGK